MPVSYSLFGLTLRSDVPLPCPEMQDQEVNAEVELRESTESQLAALRLGGPTSVDDDGFWNCMLYQNGAASVCWKDHFDFVVSGDGRQVLWRRLVEVPDEVVFTYLLGQVLSFCLLARGVEPLHATSVVVNGAAIAFLGDSGHGKSTLAAALLERGHRLLTDDVLVVRFDDGDRAMAYPSLPRIKLTGAAADAVFPGRRSVPMNRFTDKRIFPLHEAEYEPHPAPLRALYVISEKAEGPGASIRRLRGRAEFLALIQHTFNDSIRHTPRLKQQFAFARRLVRLVSVNALSYPKQLDLLPAIADAVLADAQGSCVE
jgi:hypothetical protein